MCQNTNYVLIHKIDVFHPIFIIVIRCVILVGLAAYMSVVLLVVSLASVLRYVVWQDLRLSDARTGMRRNASFGSLLLPDALSIYQQNISNSVASNNVTTASGQGVRYVLT